jgi:hypothetical protein
MCILIENKNSEKSYDHKEEIITSNASKVNLKKNVDISIFATIDHAFAREFLLFGFAHELNCP